MIKSEPKSILQFMASHYDLLRDLFDLQVKNDIITKESLNICLENYDKNIREQLTEYQILVEQNDDYAFNEPYFILFEFIHQKFKPLLPEEIEHFGQAIRTLFLKIKEGINDGFLTPFKVKRIKTTIDDYRYTTDDTIVEGEVEEGKLYEEKDFNRTIEIVEREAKRVNIFLEEANQKEKAIIFCANQAHAALIRDLVNHHAKSKDPFYCVRVTANDGEEGERLLREFQDNEKTIPTILTTSQKLSTGVDARNIRNIALLRPVNSMIEFKQIVGRGTRLFDGKEFFTIYFF